MEYLPYTYLIGWSSLNKWYYGVEYGIKKTPCANPQNLWTTYFTSSNLVKYYRKTYGEPDVVQVRKIFSKGSFELRMEASINWEKRVLSRINITNNIWLNGRIGGNNCPIALKKVVLLRYGVENVFQSQEIKDKIKATNVNRYGVEHPSHSVELLEKRNQNNINKYGVSCHFNLPWVREKAVESARKASAQQKRQQSVINKYGVSYISQHQAVKDQVADTRSKLSNRDTVKLIREYKRVFNIKLKEGWYQSSEEKLNIILNTLQEKYGIFTFNDLTSVTLVKKYSDSIRRLQQRPVVMEIKKYKEKYGRDLKLGRSWDRKSEDQLELLLERLREKYGIIE